MARIDMTKVGGALVVGAADIVAERLDVGRTPSSEWTRYTTIVPLAGVALGAIGMMWNFMPTISEGILLGATPLATKKVWDMFATPTASAAARYLATQRSTPSVMTRAGTSASPRSLRPTLRM